MNSHRRRMGAVVGAVALVAAGCSRSTPTTSPASSTSGVAVGPATSITASSPATSGGGPGDFGDLAAVCGPGQATGATAAGVTDHQLVVGTMADPGNSVVPGLDQELFDAADAFVGWCNAAGGILGRPIKLVKHDAKIFDAAGQMAAACQSDFMLVGNGEALDDTAVSTRVGCGLDEINAFTVGAKAGRAAGSLAALTNSDFESHLSAIYRQLLVNDPSVKAAFGELNSQLASVNGAGKRNAQAAKDLGFTSVYYDETPAVVDNWRTYAEKIKAAKVQVLATEDTPEDTASLLTAMGDAGYYPKYLVMEANYYNAKFLAEAGSALDHTTVLINSYVVPFELAGSQHPATAQLVSLLSRYAHAAPRALAVNAFSAWLLWAESAKACGSQLTRACVMAHAGAVKGWTGGGLHAPDDPANTAGANSPCFLTLRASPAGFAVDQAFTHPTDGIFNCDAANAVPVTGFSR